MDDKKELFRFFGILGICYVLWYIIYHAYIYPDGRIDEFVAYNIVAVNAGILNLLGYDVFVYDRVIGTWSTAGIQVINECTATEVVGLFIGFILAYPGSNIKRLLFIPVGLLLIYIVNILRILFLVLVQVYYPQHIDFSHDYTANTIFYVVIFILWMLWAKMGDDVRTPVIAGDYAHNFATGKS